MGIHGFAEEDAVQDMAGISQIKVGSGYLDGGLDSRIDFLQASIQASGSCLAVSQADDFV